MKLNGLHFADVAEIQEAVTDELKKVQKEEFSAALQKLYDRAKASICMPIELILIKKVCVFLMCLRFFKKISPKTFGPHCVCLSAWINSAPAGRIFMQFYTLIFFENLSREVKIH
jgi:hypothetical protein